MSDGDTKKKSESWKNEHSKIAEREEFAQSLPQMWITLHLVPENEPEKEQQDGSISKTNAKSTNNDSDSVTCVDTVVFLMIHIDRVENRITPMLLESLLTLQSRLGGEISMVLEALARHMRRRRDRRHQRNEQRRKHRRLLKALDSARVKKTETADTNLDQKAAKSAAAVRSVSQKQLCSIGTVST